MESKTVANFARGNKVRYVPMHAKGDKNHPDCENGIVFHTQGDTVFVKYSTAHHKVMNSYDSYATAKGTDPIDLIKLSDEEYGY